MALLVPAGAPVVEPEVPAAPAVGATAPGRPSTYRELFADEANNPAPERLADYLSGYRFAGGAGIPAPAALRDQTVTLCDRCQPMAFLTMVPGPMGVPEVAILHCLMRFMDIPGEAPTGYHDKILGLLGDIMPHQYPVVEVPGTAFHLVNTPVRVPTNDGMNALMPAWEDPTAPLGPFAEDAPETEVVRTRNIQLIPGRYAAMFVHRRGLSPKMVFQELFGHLQSRDKVAACADVLSWIKVASTARGGRPHERRTDRTPPDVPGAPTKRGISIYDLESEERSPSDSGT